MPIPSCVSIGRKIALVVATAAGCSLPLLCAAEAVKLEQIVSREDPSFNCAASVMAIGKDGRLYFCSGGNSSYVLRTERDGGGKLGAGIVYAAANATANADGVIASANGHFAAKVALYDAGLKQTGEISDFRHGDDVGWDAPAAVEAGESGDFYGVDQHRDRIVRLSPTGKLVRVYPVPRDPEGPNGKIDAMRVCEKTEAFLVISHAGQLRCIAFDGVARWSLPVHLNAPWYVSSRAYDVTPDGTIWMIEERSGTVRKVGADGQPAGEVKLDLGARAPAAGKPWFFCLRVWGDEVFVRGEDPTEIFQCYDAATGAFRRSGFIDHERLSASFPSRVWTAGESVPFEVRFESGGRPIAPVWRVWARPFEGGEYRELKLADGRLALPADLAGLYRIKLSPETQPVERGLAAQVPSEYLLQTVVELRTPQSRGTVAVVTPGLRLRYAQGETIAYQVIARTAEKQEPLDVPVRLVGTGTGVAVATRVQVPVDGMPVPLTIADKVTACLAPGAYQLVPEQPGWTCVPQLLYIGPALSDPEFFRVDYGDYGCTFPAQPSWLSAPDVTAAHLERAGKLGFNLFVDRLGWDMNGSQLTAEGFRSGDLDELVKTLAADPAGVPPEKARLAAPLREIVAGYGAQGAHEMGILMLNDAGLPLGTGYDNRKPEQIVETLRRITAVAREYPGFRGWSWASNWWIFDKRGGNAAETPEDKAAYEAALKVAKETGAWDPALDRVAGRRLGLAVEAQDLFNRTLAEVAGGRRLVTAVAAPYRNDESYPPITFSNVDEVDLQIQWEQIGVPYHCPHNVDFYQRPGKRGWAHPEIWNDDGTGGQVLPNLFLMAMRGADGVGCSGAVPPWAGDGVGLADDPRLAHYGNASVWRAANRVFAAYGPLFAALENDDRVAIAVSGRMYKIDEWHHVTGLHFARQLEAYIACLHAHHPASYVFAEDFTPETLKPFKAILVIDQRVEFETQLLAALRDAQQAGAKVLYDGTCRPELVKEFAPLGYAFDSLEKDRSPAGDDSAYWRFAEYGRAGAAALAPVLDAIVPAAVRVLDDQVLISQRKAGAGRYVWVVNNTMPRLEPGQIWRMTLGLTSRVPVKLPVKLAAPAGAVYDAFAMRRVEAANGIVEADLREVPARLFALLPEAIGSVALQTAASAHPAETVQWRVQVMGAGGKPLDAAVPVWVRAICGDRLLAETYTVAGTAGATGQFTVPLDTAAPIVVSAAELFSGLAESATVAVAQTAPAAAVTAATQPAEKAAPAEALFGPHARDLTVIDGGRLAVISAMNWDHNAYALDVKSGRQVWQQRVGQYFAFAPQACADGVALQGFDFASAEGYHLYVLDKRGNAERRFALYGVPGRLPHRFVPGMIRDHIDNFAVEEGGGWVATSGDLGMAAWSGKGKVLWSEDGWKTGDRQPSVLAALDRETLLAAQGATVNARAAKSGAVRWRLALPGAGEVRKLIVGRPRKGEARVAVLSTAQGGRIFIVSGDSGRLVRDFATNWDDAAFSPDATALAVTCGNQLKLYSIENGLQWSFAGDDRVRFPRFTADGKRLVTTTDIGSAAVLDVSGNVLWHNDLGARSVPAWLPGGDLLLASWMGEVRRLGPAYREVWRTKLAPVEGDMRGKLLAADATPTTRVEGWGNAEATPAPLAPNALASVPAIIRLVPSGGWGGSAQLAHDTKLLADGDATPPPTPWIDWSFVGFFAETSPVNYLLIDTFRTQLRLTGITLCEDPAHPESWLRDARFDYWDAEKETWVTAQALLSNAAVHTHRFASPISAARFRILLPWGAVGNVRLGEIVLHGEAVGCSHPDAAAKRPVAVLFDEQDEIKTAYSPPDKTIEMQFSGAFSGGRCLALKADAKALPLYQVPFGHTVPNWDFEIAENPAPGQYRYLRFAWKATAPSTTGMTVSLNNVGLHAGEAVPTSVVDVPRKIADTVPVEWRVETVDLWQVLGKPSRVQALSFACKGGGMLIDRILLGRTPQDLDTAAP